MKSIIEIGIEATAEEVLQIEAYLITNGIPYYIEPPNKFVSLEDLECQCEGK